MAGLACSAREPLPAAAAAGLAGLPPAVTAALACLESSRSTVLSLPPWRSIISRTDIFQRALSAKKEFYKQLAAYDEDYLGSQGAQTVGLAAPSAWASETCCKRSWPPLPLSCVQLLTPGVMQPGGRSTRTPPSLPTPIPQLQAALASTYDEEDASKCAVTEENWCVLFPCLLCFGFPRCCALPCVHGCTFTDALLHLHQPELAALCGRPTGSPCVVHDCTAWLPAGG